MRKLIAVILLALFPLLVGWQDNSGWKEDSRLTNLNFAPIQTFATSGVTAVSPDASGYTFWQTYNNTSTALTYNNFTVSDLDVGRTLIVVSDSNVVYDVTSSAIEGGTTDIDTSTGDVVTFIWNGAKWKLMSFMDMSDNLN